MADNDENKKDAPATLGKVLDLRAAFERPKHSPPAPDSDDSDLGHLIFPFLLREKARQIVAQFEKVSGLVADPVLREIQEESVMADLLDGRYENLADDEFDDITQVNLTPRAMIEITRDTPEERRMGMVLLLPVPPATRKPV